MLFVSLLKPEGHVLVARAPPAVATCGVSPGAGRPQLPARERSNPLGCQLRAPRGCPQLPLQGSRCPPRDPPGEEPALQRGRPLSSRAGQNHALAPAGGPEARAPGSFKQRVVLGKGSLQSLLCLAVLWRPMGLRASFLSPACFVGDGQARWFCCCCFFPPLSLSAP